MSINQAGFAQFCLACASLLPRVCGWSDIVTHLTTVVLAFHLCCPLMNKITHLFCASGNVIFYGKRKFTPVRCIGSHTWHTQSVTGHFLRSQNRDVWWCVWWWWGFAGYFIATIANSFPRLRYLSMMNNPAAPSYFNGGAYHQYIDYRSVACARLPPVHRLQVSGVCMLTTSTQTTCQWCVHAYHQYTDYRSVVCARLPPVHRLRYSCCFEC